MKKILVISIFVFSLIFGMNNAQAIEGIDISAWQGEIDFTKVKDSGVEIVYIRSSAGDSYVDEYFEINYEKAKEAGLDIGFYHFLTARNTEEAQNQARFFASLIESKEADCKIAMDFEVFTGLNNTEINNIASTFLTTLEELINKELVIYSDAYNAREVFNAELFTKYPLWVAEYDASYPEVNDFIGWQYTDVGKVDGINENVDRDDFKEEIYLTDKTEIKIPDIKESNKEIYYRVKYNDTLIKIAKEYDVSVSQLVTWNNIKNPNLIFPNEVLKIITDYRHQITNTSYQDTVTVVKGDTLTAIAQKYHVLISNLVTWNHIINPNLIYPNERLIIKPSTNDHLIKYIVKPGDTLTYIAKEYKTSIYELSEINKIKNPNYIIAGSTIYIPSTYIYEKD